MRENPGRFIGNPDADRIAGVDLVDMDNGLYALGVFRIDTRTRSYHAMIGKQSPEPYLYEGRFVLSDGVWEATPPGVKRFHRRRDDAGP